MRRKFDPLNNITLIKKSSILSRNIHPSYIFMSHQPHDFHPKPNHIQPSFHCRVGQYPPAQLRLPEYGPWLTIPKPETKPTRGGPRVGSTKLNGFPVPGMQSPRAQSTMAAHYFVDDMTWETILNHGEFDYIVVGSGFTALAFIDEALWLKPSARILCLERGEFWLPVHFQNLPLPFKLTLGGPSETFPWTLTLDTHQSPVRYMHGSCPFFGGRSTFWSAWSPKPQPRELRHFPQSMIDTLSKPGFWDGPTRLLNVQVASEIQDSIFGDLQTAVDYRMEHFYTDIRFSTHTESAPLSVGPNNPTSTLKFNKFSVQGKLLKLAEHQQVGSNQNQVVKPLEIALNCAVLKLGEPDRQGYVRSIDTSRGTLAFGANTKVILCAGIIPNATVLLNSFPMVRGTAGKRLTGHFLSHLVARCPVEQYPGILIDRNRQAESIQELERGVQVQKKLVTDMKSSPRAFERLETRGEHETGMEFQIQTLRRLERQLESERAIQGKFQIAAHYLAGEAGEDGGEKRQFHVQITAIHSPDPEQNADDLARECPDYAAAASAEQLKGSEKYVLFICATLGELDESNENSYIKLNGGLDPTCNIDLQVTLTARDEKLWNDMDDATVDTIAVLSDKVPTSNPQIPGVEYWHEGIIPHKKGYWSAEYPGRNNIRIPGIVHEASTLPMNRDATIGTVNEDYQVHGVNEQGEIKVINNVYVTGAAIFPTSGSWNPTLTMCGLTQDLARKLASCDRELID